MTGGDISFSSAVCPPTRPGDASFFHFRQCIIRQSKSSLKFNIDEESRGLVAAEMQELVSDSRHDSSSDDDSDSSSDDDSDSSVTNSSADSSGTDPDPHICEHFAHVPPDTEYAQQVQRWTTRIPIGLGLCPWAGRSHNQGRLRYVTCEGDKPADVVELIAAETALLDGETAPPLCSTLIVCPNVAQWNEFQVFQEFVQSGIQSKLKDQRIQEQFTFVAFHPEFLRWRGLPKGLEVGSVIKSHWGMIGRKSAGETVTATIIETGNKAFGLRKVKVRFHEVLEGRRPEQFVPIEWIDLASYGPPLPDNIMHQTPYPTIHIIANRDLASLRIRDISRVKRRNAHKMMRLGWPGVTKRLSDH
jgi:hypothetical protein